MISNLVHGVFDVAQDRLYAWQKGQHPAEELTSDDKGDKKKGISPATISALPVAIVDGLLEFLRPLCVAVESAVLASMNFIAIFYHLAKWDGVETRRSMRVTLLNLHDMVENLALTPLRAITAIFLIAAQTGRTLTEPRDPKSMALQFPIEELPLEETAHTDMFCMYDAIRNYKYDLEDITDDMANISMQKPSDAPMQQSSSLALSRLIAIPLAIGDSVGEILQSALITAGNGVDGAFKGLHALNQCSTEDTRAAFIALRQTEYFLAKLITKIVTFPLTLIAQGIAVAYDPYGAKQSSIGLYEPNPGDIVYTLMGKMEKMHSLMNDSDSGWKFQQATAMADSDGTETLPDAGEIQPCRWKHGRLQINNPQSIR